MTRDLGVARRTGTLSAVFGGIAGIVQLLVGSRPWTGDKNDPVALGLATLVLAGVLLIAALATRRATTTDRALAVALAFALAALLGLTTAGAVWVPAWLAGLAAAGLAGRGAACAGSVGGAIRRNWTAMLLAVLAFTYVALGMTLAGPAGLAGVAGAIAVVGAVTVRSRSRGSAAALLVVGAVPFAVATSWSLVVPLTGLLLIAIGLPVILLGAQGPSPALTPLATSLHATPRAEEQP